MDYTDWIGTRVKLKLSNDFLNTSHWTFKNDMNNVKSYILSYYKEYKYSTCLCVNSEKFSTETKIWTIYIPNLYKFELLLINNKTIVI